MRILFITGLTGYGLGGARTEEIRLVSGAAARGAQVAMCSDVLANELAGTRHFRLDYPPAEPRASQQVNDAVHAFAPDVAHVVGGGVRFLQVCETQLRALPWLFTAHNVPPAERIFPRLHGKPRLHYAIRNALALPNVVSWSRYLKRARFALAVCHSETVARRLADVGCPMDKIVQIPFGSELPNAVGDTVFPEDAWPRIVTVAGLAHHKGQLDALQMAARLLPDFPRLSYRMVGMTRDKSYRAFLERMIGKLGLSNHVALLHSASEDVKFAALREADLYLQPSHEEGFCIAFLEGAMVSARLLGADTGAIAQIAAGDPLARVVKPGDVAALERAARELLKLDAAPEALAQRRESLARRYDWNAYIDAHLRAYEKVISTGRADAVGN